MSKEQIIETHADKLVTLFNKIDSILEDAVEEAYDKGYDCRLEEESNRADFPLP